LARGCAPDSSYFHDSLHSQLRSWALAEICLLDGSLTQAFSKPCTHKVFWASHTKLLPGLTHIKSLPCFVVLFSSGFISSWCLCFPAGLPHFFHFERFVDKPKLVFLVSFLTSLIGCRCCFRTVTFDACVSFIPSSTHHRYRFLHLIGQVQDDAQEYPRFVCCYC
jgi:hypothetical protein